MHEIPNGVPLRRDLHRLFDLGYVTIRPDLRVAVSRRLRDEYANVASTTSSMADRSSCPAIPKHGASLACRRPRSSAPADATRQMSTDIEVDTYSEPLTAVRQVLDGADDALLGVAFVQQRGVNLLERELATLGRGRLVATTVFGATTVQGLETARTRGLAVRVLNPSHGTFHPKLYVARHGDQLAAAVGSANLTSGLIANVEAVAVLRGHHSAAPLARLWELAGSWWEHDDAVDWSPGCLDVPSEVLQPDVLAAVNAVVGTGAEVFTLGDGRVGTSAGALHHEELAPTHENQGGMDDFFAVWGRCWWCG